jgi:hypothetical protein
MKNFFTLFYLLAVSIVAVNAQGAADYSFSTSSGNALDPMAGAVTICASSIDDTGQPSVAIGFNFDYCGAAYDNIAVTPDGFAVLRAGAFTCGSDFSNLITGPVAANTTMLFPWWDDLATGTNGLVTTSLVGTAPNQIRVVNWFVTMPRATAGPATVNFQLWLYETTNVIEFRYGDVSPLGTTLNASVGILNNIGGLTFNSVSVATHTASTTTANDANAGYDTNISGTGRSYVFTPPTCPAPGGAVALNVTEAAALLTWNSTGAGIMNMVEVGPTGFALGTGTLTSLTNDSLAVSGLTAQTTYQFYVRTTCAVGDTSLWTGALAFTTLCAAVPTPVLENFETVAVAAFGDLGNCWTTTPTTGFRWESENSTGANENSTLTGPFTDHTLAPGSGGIYMYTESSSGVTGDIAYLNSPFVDLSGMSFPVVNFWYHMYGATMGSLSLEINDGSGWTTLTTITGQQQTAGGDDWNKVSVDLFDYSGVVSFRFAGVRGTSFTSDMSLDDVSISEAPTCDFTLDMQDSFGDGWNGASVDVSVNGVSAGSFSAAGAGSMATFAAPTGALIELTYVSGIFDNEVTYQLLDPSGTTLFNDGINPTIGLAFSTTANCPSCASPTALTVSAISKDSALVSWTAALGATDYNWELQPFGVPQGTAGALASGTGFVGTSVSTGTILASSTAYTFYVQTNCGIATSVFVPVNFTTNPDYCGGDLFLDSGGASGNYQNSENLTYIICPDNLGDVVTLTFTSIAVESCCDVLNVYEGSGITGAPFALDLEAPPANGYTSTALDGCITVTFTSDNSVALAGWSATVACALPPTCLIPTATSVDSIAAEEVYISFVPGTIAPFYEVEAVLAGQPQGSGVVTTVSDTFAVISGLTPNTAYSFFLRGLCSPTDSSFWIPAGNATTLRLNDLGVTAITAPVSGCGLEATPLTITVENFGLNTLYYVPVVVEITGDITGVYTLVIDSLPGLSTSTLTLDSLNTLAGGAVDLTAFTNLATDSDNSNDTTLVSLTFGIIPMAPMLTDLSACEGSDVALTAASIGILSWYESAASASPFFQGDTLMFTAMSDTSFYVGQQETFSGTFTLDMFDSFGDGWNGASVGIEINGVGVLNSPFTFTTGSFAQETFTAGHGDSITVIYTSGSFDTEVSFTISDSQGNPIIEVAPGAVTPGVMFDQEIVSAGCPGSLAMVSVTVNPTYFDSVSVIACDSMMIAGVNQTASGVYTDSLTTASGCDSIIVYDLTINASNEESVSATICDAATYTLPDGMVVNTTGLYLTTITNAAGCDSLVKTDLTVVASYSVSQNVQICADDSLVVGTNAYNATGTYTDILTSVGGCDSSVTTNLVVYPAVNVTLGGVSTVCDNSAVIDLTLDPIGGTLSGPGVTGTSFDASAAGVGSHVLVYAFTGPNGCAVSASLNVEVVVCTGIDNIEGIETISIYPNPYVSALNVMFTDAVSGELNIKLFDITGRVLMTQNVNTTVGVNNISLDVPADIAAGVTLLQIERNGAIYSTTLIKE